MPLTQIIKKVSFPLHCIVNADEETGLDCDSMVLGEQPYTLDKQYEVVKKIGSVKNPEERARINKICFDTLFMGENYQLEVC